MQLYSVISSLICQDVVVHELQRLSEPNNLIYNTMIHWNVKEMIFKNSFLFGHNLPLCTNTIMCDLHNTLINQTVTIKIMHVWDYYVHTCMILFQSKFCSTDTRQSASIYKALKASKFTHQRLLVVDTVTDVPLPEDFPTFYQPCAKANADGRKVTLWVTELHGNDTYWISLSGTEM